MRKGKERVSATIDFETKKLLDEILKKGKHRNISHIIEEAIKEFGKGSKNE